MIIEGVDVELILIDVVGIVESGIVDVLFIFVELIFFNSGEFGDNVDEMILFGLVVEMEDNDDGVGLLVFLYGLIVLGIVVIMGM